MDEQGVYAQPVLEMFARQLETVQLEITNKQALIDETRAKIAQLESELAPELEALAFLEGQRGQLEAWRDSQASKPIQKSVPAAVVIVKAKPTPAKAKTASPKVPKPKAAKSKSPASGKPTLAENIKSILRGKQMGADDIFHELERIGATPPTATKPMSVVYQTLSSHDSSVVGPDGEKQRGSDGKLVRVKTFERVGRNLWRVAGDALALAPGADALLQKRGALKKLPKSTTDSAEAV